MKTWKNEKWKSLLQLFCMKNMKNLSQPSIVSAACYPCLKRPAECNWILNVHRRPRWHREHVATTQYQHHALCWPEFIMLSPSNQFQRTQQTYQHRPSNHTDRFQYMQQCKMSSPQRPTNMGHELLTKLEQAGKVPSREKFRRMCCQVIFLLICVLDVEYTSNL